MRSEAAGRGSALHPIVWGSAALILGVTFGLGVLLAQLFSIHVLNEEGRHTAEFVRHAVQTGRAAGGADPWAAAGHRLQEGFPGMLRVDVYDPGKRILWSTREDFIGARVSDDRSLDRSVTGHTVTMLDAPSRTHVPFAPGVSRILHVYVPVRSPDGGRVEAVIRTHENGDVLYAAMRRVERTTWTVAGAAGLLLWVAVIWVIASTAQWQRRAQTAERGELEQRLSLTERLRATGEIAAGMAHDLNNLFTTILARVDLLRATDGPDPQSVTAIERAAEDAVEIVRRLRELARYRRGGQRERLDPNTLLDDALAVTQPRWHGRAKIQAEVKRGEVPPVMGRTSELREALVNLILNAVDAMPNGGRLTLSSHRAGDRVVLEVTDTGVGIPTEIQRRIFDPFFTTKPEGSGLGLSVAYGIIRQHHGDMTVESTPDSGTTFRLALPAIDKPLDD